MTSTISFLILTSITIILLLFLYLHAVYVEVYEVEFNRMNINACNVLGIHWIADVSHEFDDYWIHENLHHVPHIIKLIPREKCSKLKCMKNCPDCRNIVTICHITPVVKVRPLFSSFVFSIFGLPWTIPILVSKNPVNFTINNITITNVPIVKLQEIVDSKSGFAYSKITWNTTLCGDYYDYKPFTLKILNNETIDCTKGIDKIRGVFEYSHSKKLIRYALPVLTSDLIKNDSICTFYCRTEWLIFKKCYISCKVRHKAYKVQDTWVMYSPFLVVEVPEGKYIIVVIEKPIQFLWFFGNGIRTVVGIELPKTYVNVTGNSIKCINNTCITINPIKLLEVRESECTGNELLIMKIRNVHRQKTYNICLKIRYIDLTNRFEEIKHDVNYEVKIVEKNKTIQLPIEFKIEQEDIKPIMLTYATNSKTILKINITTWLQLCVFNKCIDIKI